jgi:putative phage-type endonuclease
MTYGHAVSLGHHEAGSIDWHRIRHGGIGGSEIAAVMGLSKWSGPHSVWAEKVAPFDPDAVGERKLIFDVGHALEPVALEYLENAIGLAVVADVPTLAHPDYEWARVNLDGVAWTVAVCGLDETWNKAIRLDQIVGGVEAKTTDGRNLATWDNEGVPIYYQCQCQWQMFVTGFDRVFVPVIFGGRTFRYWVVERDEEDIAALLEGARQFWRYVQTKTPPPIDASEAARAYLVDKYGHEAKGEAVELDDDASRWVAQYEEAKNLEEVAAEMKAEAANHLLASIGDAPAGIAPTGHRISVVRSRRFDYGSAVERNPGLVDEYRTRLDESSLKREHPEFYNACRTKVSAHIRIGKPKGK